MPIGRRNCAGQIVRKIATPIPTGTATIIASADVTMVRKSSETRQIVR